jgi:hypothetical protein
MCPPGLAKDKREHGFWKNVYVVGDWIGGREQASRRLHHHPPAPKRSFRPARRRAEERCSFKE